eukprot:jgi/Astpho2/1532/gw1.00026.150.1_t
MFLLSRMQDSVQVQPQDLGKTPVDAIRAELEASCYDKVLPEIGLAGKQLQLTQLSDGGNVAPGEGSALYEVKFELLSFKPFPGQVLKGKVKSCNRDGIAMTLGFFDDVFVPGDVLTEEYQFKSEENVWVWNHPDKDIGELMRVQEVNFKPIPTASELQIGNANGPTPKGLPGNPFAPLEIVANITEDGLGLEAWWGE